MVLRDRITIQRPTYIVEPSGDGNRKVIDPDGWVDVARSIAAVVECTGGAESLDSGRPTIVNQYKITVRNQRGIDPTCRVRVCDQYGVRTIQLTAVFPESTKKWLNLYGAETKEPTDA